MQFILQSFKKSALIHILFNEKQNKSAKDKNYWNFFSMHFRRNFKFHTAKT